MGCRQADPIITDYSEYYIPIRSLPGEGKVYRYTNMTDSLGFPEIWKHTRLGPDRLESINYTPDGNMIMRQYDRVIPDGILTDSLIMNMASSTGGQQPVSVKVVSPNRFPFHPGDSSKVWLTQFEWIQPGDSLHIVLQRRRSFASDTSWTYQGKTVPAVKFSTDDTLETEAEGWTTSNWKGEEIYAKGIGLVYYKRRVSDDLVLEYALEE